MNISNRPKFHPVNMDKMQIMGLSINLKKIQMKREKKKGKEKEKAEKANSRINFTEFITFFI